MSNHRYHKYREYDGWDYIGDGLGLLLGAIVFGSCILAFTATYS